MDSEGHCRISDRDTMRILIILTLLTELAKSDVYFKVVETNVDSYGSDESRHDVDFAFVKSYFEKLQLYCNEIATLFDKDDLVAFKDFTEFNETSLRSLPWAQGRSLKTLNERPGFFGEKCHVDPYATDASAYTNNF